MKEDKQVVDYMDCLFLPVLDKQQAVQWYQEKLGLKWNGYSFDLGSGPEIMLVQVNQEEDVNLTYLTDHWEGINYTMQIATFYSSDIEKTHHTLKERSVEVDEIQLFDSNRKCFRFYDLYRNRFEVWSGWLK